MSNVPSPSRIPQDVTVAELVAALKAKPPVELASVKGDLLKLTRSDVQDTISGAGEAADTAPEDPRLAAYKAQYDRWSAAEKTRCLWAEVKERLLGNDSEDLKRAEAMPEGGILFGLDKQGNLLIANGGLGPVLTNMNYQDTRKAVRFTEQGGKQAPTGYEMLSEEAEIRAFEAFTGQPVVRTPEGFEPSPEDNGYRGIWRESGDNPDWARHAYVDPGSARARLYVYYPSLRLPGRGVRCLLRVLEKS
ncbi:MAG: hypothetical protein V1908_01950 [Candidatus Peregrinibacteria bacterium]